MNNKTLKISLVILLSSLSIACVFFILKFTWISADAPFYLAIARDLSEGQVMYKDFINVYTPLMMEINSLLYKVIVHPSYSVFILFQIGVILSQAVLFFLLIRNIVKLDLIVSLIVSCAFILAVLSSDGNYINLEVYSAFFVIAAFFFVLQDKYYFISGVLLELSFLCKQYGVLNFIPFALFVLLHERLTAQRIKKIAYLASGGLLVLFAFLFFYVVVQEVPFESLIAQLTGKGYAKMATNKEKRLSSFLLGGKILFFFLPVLILHFVKHRHLSKVLIFALTGIVVNLLPMMLQFMQHYFINTFPYLFLCIAYILKDSASRTQFVLIACAALVSGVLLIDRIFRYRGNKAKQLAEASEVKKYLPPGSRVFIYGPLRHLYFLNNYHNPFAKTIGYNFAFPKGAGLEPGELVLVDKILPLKGWQFQKIESKTGPIYIYK